LPSVSEVAGPAACRDLLRAAAAAGRTISIERPGGDIVLSTARLARVLEHEAGDLTVAVEAGIRLSELDRRLASHGQRLSLDPPGDPTVGACIAGNQSGPLRHRYGAPRDLLLGITVVLGDGTVASSGGKVVKNVAGYDLARLFCGSGGRFGVIVFAALRLHPRPAAARTLVVSATSPLEAATAWQALLHSALVPSAVDLLWPGRLVALFEGTAEGVEAQISAARALLGGAEGEPSVWDESRARQAAAGGRMRFVPGELQAALSNHDEALVRPAAGVAYVADPVPEPEDRALATLVARLKAQFDPDQVLT
jgi:FAD/FMN-containing dehydrogenase